MNQSLSPLASLKARFIAGLSARLDRMQVVLASPEPSRDVKALQRESHSLVGAAGIHGLDALAGAAARLNQALVHARPEAEVAALYQELVLSVHQLTTLTLPVTEASVESKERVRVVCQGQDERESLCTLLASDGWQVDAWADHAEAAGASPADAPVVHVLSLQCAGGIEAGLLAIRQTAAQWPSVPILVTTAYRDLSIRLSALRAGATCVVVKPYSHEELLQRIRHIRRSDAGDQTVVVLSDASRDPLPDGQAPTAWPTGWHVATSVDMLSGLLETQACEAVVLDRLPEGASHVELTTLLQDGPCCGRLPVIWRLPRRDPVWVGQAALVGAAAVVDAEHPMDVLVNVVRQQASQARLHTSRMQRLQTALYEATQQRRALDHHAAVSLIDAHGEVVDTSPRLTHITGYTLEQHLGAHVCEARPGKVPPELPAAALQVAEQQGIWQGRLALNRADQSPYWADATLVPFVDQHDRVYRFLLARSDVTRQVLADQALEQKRQADLAAANLIQSTLLVPSLPHCPSGVSVAARFQASGGVAGDFHELVEPAPGVLDVLLGDVMGKGVPAGLIGAAVKLELSRCRADLAHRLGGRLATPAEIVGALHERLTPRLMALNSYVTLSYLRLDRGKKQLLSVGCGHPQSLLIDGHGVLALPNDNLPLGILAEEVYEQTEHPLPDGATVVLYSDGLTEATSACGEAFGTSRLETLAAELAQGHADARLTANGLLAQVHAHTADVSGAQDDDQTLVVLRVPDTDERFWSLPRSLDAITTLRQHVGSHTCLQGVNESVTERLLIAAVEAFTNTVRHGQPTDDDLSIGLAVGCDHGRLWVQLTDIGVPFVVSDLVTEPDPRRLAEGGYGLSLIQNACDEVSYTARDGINRCRLAVYV